MPNSYQQQFDKDRARQAVSAQRPVAPAEPAAFPWGIFFVAVIFDIIGMIPVINFFTELLAGLILGMWQKSYVQKLDPLLTFFVAKIIDAMFLGLLPSNIGIVVYSYLKKKSLSLSKTSVGQMALKKVSLPQTQQS